ncbi:MAG: tripartite tricarboxylate transporter substrate-binding protein [Burkholderiales bacterium]
MPQRPAAWRPEHAVELIAGTPPGGGQDRPARALIKALEAKRLVGVPVMLTNIPGRGGGNAWDTLRQRAGDPHVLAINSPTIITNRLLDVSDFDHAALTPLANLYTEYIAFVVRADSRIRTGADFMARLTADTGSLPIAMATARGNTNHMALGQITQQAGGDVKALRLNVFDSARYAVADVIEGHAEVGAITAVSALPELAAGTLRAFALSAPARMSGQFASVPTWVEQGVNCVIGTWRGVIGAQGLTAEQIAFWDGALAAATQSEEWNAELAHHYWANTYRGSVASGEFLARERGALETALKNIGLAG